MIFLNLLLIGGLLAAAAPVLVHILHRRRMQRIDWGAMRWLQVMLARQRRRLRIEHWLLLLLRMAALLLLALALMRPQWGGDQEASLKRQGAVAAVLLIDNSLTSGMRVNEQERLDQLKDWALAYLDGLQLGDEVSIISADRLGQELPPPLYDLAAAQRLINELESSELPGDIPSLWQAGLGQLRRHLNPQREVVLFSDGAANSWRQDQRGAWSALRRSVDDHQGVQLILAQAEHQSLADIALSSLASERDLLAVGETGMLRLQLDHYAESDGAAPPPLRLRLRGGAKLETVHYDEALSLEANERRSLSIPLRLEEAGPHPLIAEILGARDSLPANDQRALVVEAFQGLPVLVVEGESGPGLTGSGAFIALALEPDADDPAKPFAVTRIAVDDLAAHPLHTYRSIILAGVDLLDAEAQARLEQALASGVGLLVAPSLDADVDHLNGSWARDGQGFLATTIAAVSSNAEAPLAAAVALPGHAALRGLREAGDQGLRGAEVSRHLRLDERAGDSVPLRWSNGDPALVIASRGLGRSAVLAGGSDLQHSRLPLSQGWAPFVRSLVADLASPTRPPYNLQPGQRLTVVGDASPERAEGPDGAAIALQPGSWDGRQVMNSAPLLHSGIYRVHGSDDSTRFFAVAGESASDGGRSLSADGRNQLLAGLDPHRIDTRDGISALGDASRRAGTELWPWFIVASILLLLTENLAASRMAGRANGPAKENP